jgi:hypothetical protein
MYWAAIINFGSLIVLFFFMEEVRCISLGPVRADAQV